MRELVKLIIAKTNARNQVTLKLDYFYGIKKQEKNTF